MIKFKTVQFHPSNWKLDIWNVPNKEMSRMNKLAEKRYGYCSRFDQNECALMETADTSILKGESRIVIVYDGRDFVLIHEMIHALWYYSKHSGVEMNYDSQEWQAILFEYLYIEALKNNWKKL
jgi:hypothetical protein